MAISYELSTRLADSSLTYVNGKIKVSDALQQQLAAAVAYEEVPVARFAPNQVLDNTNFDAALRAAYQWCLDQLSTPTRTFAYAVVMPPGVWTVQPTTLAIPGTALTGFRVAPSLWGAGKYQTTLVLASPLAEGVEWLSIGKGVAGNMTVGCTIKGFTLTCDVVSPGNGTGNGIVAYQSYKCTVKDVRVEGLAAPQDYESGWGIKFVGGQAVSGGANEGHQHVNVHDCDVSICQSGATFRNIAQGGIRNLWVSGCTWLDVTFDRVLGLCWDGSGTIQSSQTMSAGSTNASWFDGTLTPCIATGWDSAVDLRSGSSVPLPSGSAATLGVTTKATDADTGITNVGTCVMTGLSGMARNHVGCWLKLASADAKIAGLYQIVEYLSPTSVRINKGTPHISTAGLTWAVLGTTGGNQVDYSGYPYHEGPKRCVFFAGPDLNGDSTYDMRGLMSYNTMPAIAQGCGSLRMFGAGPIVTTKALRLKDVNRCDTDMLQNVIVTDDYSRAGLVCRARVDLGNYRGSAGVWQGDASTARGLDALVTERGGFSWNPARTDKLTLATLDISQARSVQDDTVLLAPQYGGSKPTLDTADAVFGTPCWVLGGAAGVTKNLEGTIAQAKLPSGSFGMTLIVVARLVSTTVDAGGVRRVRLESASGGRNTEIAFNDGAYFATGNYGILGGNQDSGSYCAGQGQRIATVDTLPHCYAVQFNSRLYGRGAGNFVDDQMFAGMFKSFSISGGSAQEACEVWPNTGAMTVRVLHDFGTGADTLRVAWLAVVPYQLTPNEIQQVMDMAALKYKIVR